MNGLWKVNFQIKCHHSYGGSCTITAPETTNFDVTFDTASDNYCPRIVDTIDSTAVLNVYEDDLHTKTQSQFVFGTNSYFKATVTSAVKVAAIYTEEIAVTLGYLVRNDNIVAAGGNGFGSVSSGARQIIYANPYVVPVGTPAIVTPALVDKYFSGTEDVDASCSGRSGINSVLSTWRFGTFKTGTGLLTTRCYALQDSQWRLQPQGDPQLRCHSA